MLLVLAVLFLLHFAHLHLVARTTTETRRQEFTTATNRIIKRAPLAPLHSVGMRTVKLFAELSTRFVS